MFKLPPRDAEEFGEHLKTARIRKNLSQVELAAACGISKVLPSRYEKGKCKPSERTWAVLNQVLFGNDSPSQDESDETLLSDASIDQLVEALKKAGAATVAITF